MKSFISALQFLTIIPARLSANKNTLAQSAAFFPLIGLLLGVILAGANNLSLLLALEEITTNVILVVSLIILTGGLHLDGLADTFDALSSGKNRLQMQEIMRDSHVGAMGVLSLVSIILLKISLLCCLPAGLKNISLILMCLFSRYSLVFLIFCFPYARKEGKAKVFKEGMNLKTFLLATLIAISCAIMFSQLRGLIFFILVAGFSLLAGRFITKRVGGMTGDTLGAISELTEVFVLFNVLMINRSYL